MSQNLILNLKIFCDPKISLIYLPKEISRSSLLLPIQLISKIKTIFKCSKFNAIHDKNNPSDHHPVFPINENLKIINSINLQQMDLYQKDYNLINEKIIKNSFLLCYHYRIISEEHALNKIKTRRNKKQGSQS